MLTEGGTWWLWVVCQRLTVWANGAATAVHQMRQLHILLNMGHGPGATASLVTAPGTLTAPGNCSVSIPEAQHRGHGLAVSAVSEGIYIVDSHSGNLVQATIP